MRTSCVGLGLAPIAAIESAGLSRSIFMVSMVLRRNLRKSVEQAVHMILSVYISCVLFVLYRENGYYPYQAR